MLKIGGAAGDTGLFVREGEGAVVENRRRWLAGMEESSDKAWRSQLQGQAYSQKAAPFQRRDWIPTLGNA
jgi:hypothetical protein